VWTDTALKKVRYCILFRPIIKMSEINKTLKTHDLIEKDTEGDVFRVQN
jgi:hypothetical protein